MKEILMAALTSIMSSAVPAQTTNFDGDPVGVAPSGWTCGVTGRGAPRWEVSEDESAPSKPNVLMQYGSGTFPWCIKTGTALADGFVEVKFKPLSGREDQAG